jgi:hypothetical protein
VRIGVVAVNNNTNDVGEHKLGPGATITGKIELGKHGRLPDALVAVDSNGLQIEAPACAIRIRGRRR